MFKPDYTYLVTFGKKPIYFYTEDLILVLKKEFGKTYEDFLEGYTHEDVEKLRTMMTGLEETPNPCCG